MKKFNLYSSLGFIFGNTSFQAKQNLTALFHKNGFDSTVDQFSILAALQIEDGITQTQLSGRSCKQSSNLTRILTGMEEKGLLLRLKGCDARSRNVHISQAGRTLYKALSAITENYFQHIFSGLTEEEQRTFADMLHRIQNNL